jgi:hypothetical protein
LNTNAFIQFYATNLIVAELEAEYLRHDARRGLDRQSFGQTGALGHTQYFIQTFSLEL